MPVGYNPETGEVLRLGLDGEWSPTRTGKNPQTGELLALDGDVWVKVEKPVDLANEVKSVGAGANRGITNALGSVVDLAALPIDYLRRQGAGTGALISSLLSGDLSGAPAAAEAARAGVQPTRGFGGSESLRSGLEAIPLPGDLRFSTTPTAETMPGRIASRVAQEVGATAAGGGMLNLAGRAARPLATAAQPVSPGRAVFDAMTPRTGGQLANQAYIGTGAGLGAAGANEAFPGSPTADFVGALLGGATAGLTQAGVNYGTGGVKALFAPFTEKGRADIVANTIRRSATRPGDLSSTIDGAAPGLAGTRGTLAEVSGDPGLAATERAMRSINPAASGEFTALDAANNAARRAALDAAVPDSEGAQTVRDYFTTQLGNVRNLSQRAIDAAVANVDAQLRALGPGASREEAGRIIRDGLASARASAKGSESALWQRLEGRPDLALPIASAREAGRSMLDEVGPYAAAPQGDVGGILKAAAGLPEVVRYRDLQQLRSRALQAASELKRAGNAVDLRRVQAVVSGLDDDLARAAGVDPGSAPVVGATAAPRAAGEGPQQGGRIYTPGGMAIDTRYELLDLAGPNAPIASHTVDLRPNPSFPSALQPRDRTRAASEAQVVKMAGELNPQRLGAGGVGDGAPIIGPDNFIESGNGRTLAIARAYMNNGPQAQAYRQWLEGQGLDTSGMQFPALVRRRVNDLSPQERARFVEEANGGPGLRLSAVEQAKNDAFRVGDDVLRLYRGGALDDAANRDFVRAFVGKLPEGDLGAVAARGGGLSAEGLRRLEGAMLAKAYGPESSLVGQLIETGDDNIRALGRALTDAAPAVAQLKASIRSGDVPAQFDPTKALLDAARAVQKARASGQPIGNVLAQRDALNPIDPLAAEFLAAAYGDGFRRVSYGRASEALRTYIGEASRQTKGAGLFGDGPSAADMWGAARRRAAGIADDTAAPAPQPLAMPAASTPETIVPDALTPSFGPDDAALYRSARDATANRKQTFDRGAVGDVLRQGGYQSRDGIYAMPAEQVAARFFNRGRASAADVREFIAAAGGHAEAQQALREYVVGSIRGVAVDESGRVNAARWGSWLSRHERALQAFPELRRELQGVSNAQRLADDAMESLPRSVEEVQRGAARFFLNADPERAVASSLSGSAPRQNIQELVRLAGGDMSGAARRGLQRAIVEEMKAKGTTTATAYGGEPILAPGAFVKWYDRNRAAIAPAFSEDQLHVFDALKFELQRRARVDTVNRSVGSDTFQKLSTGNALQALVGRLFPERWAVSKMSAVETAARPLGWIYKEPEARVQELLYRAMLDPKLAGELLKRVTPANEPVISQALKGALAQSVVARGEAANDPGAPRGRVSGGFPTTPRLGFAY